MGIEAALLAAGAPAFLASATAVGAQLLVVTAASTLLAKRALSTGNPVRQRTISSRGTTDAQAVIYGEALVAGTLAYRNVHGNKNSELWAVHVFAGHEVDAITDVYLDADLIQNAWIAGGSAAGGGVTTGKYGPQRPGVFTASIFKHYGTSTQTVDTNLESVSADWTPDHRLRGHAYCVTKFRLNDKTEKIWEGGDPTNVKFLVRGKRVYDPRAAAGQDKNDPATWTWSDNPALCWADMLRDSKFSPLVGGIDVDRIDWVSVEIAADACDALVDIPGGQEKRFTCNGVIYGTATPRENIASILSSMNGWQTFTGGLYRVFAGVYAGPADTIGEDDIIGPISYSSALSSDRRVNTMKATYIDRDKLYEPTETRAITIQTLLERDNNRELIETIELPMVGGWYQAQRMCLQMLKEANLEETIELTCNLRAMALVPGERVNLVIPERGWNPKICKVIEWSLFDRGGDQIGVRVKLRSDDPLAYTDPLETDYNTLSPSGVIQLAEPEIIPSPDTIPPGVRYGQGAWNITLIPNATGGGSTNPGEIGVGAGDYVLHDGTVRVSPQFTVFTPYEDAGRPPDGRFYLVWGVEDTLTRFPGSGGMSSPQGAFAATYDRTTGEWYAVDNGGQEFLFTPLDTDYVVATGLKFSEQVGSDIESLTAVVAYVDDPRATAGATWNDNIVNQPADSDIQNTNQQWNDVTGTGRPADNATQGATWNGDILGQPADGDIANTNQQWADVGGAGKPEDDATRNTGALADKDLVQQLDVENNAVVNTTISIDTSTRSFLGSVGTYTTLDAINLTLPANVLNSTVVLQVDVQYAIIDNTTTTFQTTFLTQLEILDDNNLQIGTANMTGHIVVDNTGAASVRRGVGNYTFYLAATSANLNANQSNTFTLRINQISSGIFNVANIVRSAFQATLFNQST